MNERIDVLAGCGGVLNAIGDAAMVSDAAGLTVQAAELREARAAVAELIGAAQALFAPPDDLTGVRVSAGDYSKEDLSQLIRKSITRTKLHRLRAAIARVGVAP